MRRLLLTLCLLSTGVAEAQDRWFAPRLWLRAFTHNATAVVVEPQTGYWPEGVWLSVHLDGRVEALTPPTGCRWTAMTFSPIDGRTATAAFCPAPACRDARAMLMIEGREVWSERSRHLMDLVWRADGGGVAGLLSQFGGVRARGLGALNKVTDCSRTPLGLAEFGDGDLISDLPATLPPTTPGLRLTAHDGRGYLAEIGYDSLEGFFSLPSVTKTLEAYCDTNPDPAFGRPCGVAVGAVLARIEGGAADVVRLGGGPITARTLVGPEAKFILSETCEVEQLGRRRIRSRCDLLRWDAPFDTARRLTNMGAVLGGLALSGDGRMIAALNPFDGAESSLMVIDAETGEAATHPIGAWVRAAFEATGRTVHQEDDE